MDERLRQFLVLFAGTAVAAAVITVLLAPPNELAALLTFAVVLIAALALAYVIGYLGTSWGATAYATSDGSEIERTDAARADEAAFRWMVREGIGVSIASLFGVLLLALFLMEETALVRSPGFTIGGVAEWLLLVVLALALSAVALWSWRGR